MEIKVVWTEEATNSHEEIFLFLIEIWNIKIAKAFVQLVDEKIRKRKLKAHAKFATAVKTATGLDLKPAPAMSGRSASLCASCFTGSTTTSYVMRNVLTRWINHAKSCPGLVKTVTLAPEAQRFVLQCMAGGDKHRRITCDAYIAT